MFFGRIFYFPYIIYTQKKKKNSCKICKKIVYTLKNSFIYKKSQFFVIGKKCVRY